MRHESFPAADPFPGIPKPRKAPARELIERVGAWHGIGRDEILGRAKPDNVVEARFDAVAAVRVAYPHLSRGAIGRIFGGRDPSTIRNTLKRRGLK